MCQKKTKKLKKQVSLTRDELNTIFKSTKRGGEPTHENRGKQYHPSAGQPFTYQYMYVTSTTKGSRGGTNAYLVQEEVEGWVSCPGASGIGAQVLRRGGPEAKSFIVPFREVPDYRRRRRYRWLNEAFGCFFNKNS